MSLIEIVEKVFQYAFVNLLKKKNIPTEEKIEIKIERAREETLGDYACTSAMDKKIRELVGIKNPKELANIWLDELTKLNISDVFHHEFLYFIKTKETIDIFDLFEKIEIAGSGFINVFIHKNLLFYFVYKALLNPEEYGNTKKENPENIIFEFVSANPTGPLNIVSARSAALGDSCCNLLEASGDHVYREYYVNDYGNQIDLLGMSILLRICEQKEIPLKFSQKQENGLIYEEKEGIPFPSEGYHGDYIIQIAKKIIQEKIIDISKEQLQRLKEISSQRHLQESDLETILDEDLRMKAKQLSEYAVNYFVNLHKQDLNYFRVKFDSFFLESSLHKKGEVKKMIEKLGNYIYEKDSKIYFRSTDFGDDQDRVVIRNNGNPTYLLADIAYHYSKIQRKFTKIINIWGPDHHGYIARLKGAVQALGFKEDDFKILIAQQVTLKENGKPIVMSKRAGKIIQMKELLEEVPIDVARYFFIMRSFESPLDFDLTEAKDTSEKNPYYYVAYAHARIQSIFSKLEEENQYQFQPTYFANEKAFSHLLKNLQKMDFSSELMISQENHYRRNLLFSIARFAEEIQFAAKYFEPHHLVQYLYSMANLFSKFYMHKNNRILKVYQENKEEFEVLSVILFALKICLKRGLQLLGMEAPDRL